MEDRHWHEQLRDFLIACDHTGAANHVAAMLAIHRQQIANLQSRNNQQDARILQLETKMDELQKALAALTQAATDLQARAGNTVNVADLAPLTAGINTAVDAINSVLPASTIAGGAGTDTVTT